MDENPYKAPQTEGAKPLSPSQRRLRIWWTTTMGLLLSKVAALFFLMMGWISGMAFVNYVVGVLAALGALALWADPRKLCWFVVLFWLFAAVSGFALYIL